MVSGPFATAAPDGTREELGELRTRIEQTAATLNRDRAELNDLHEELSEVDRAIGEMNRRVRETRKHILTRSAGIRESESELSRIDADIKERRSQLESLVVASYVSGRAEYLKLLLNQQNPADIGRFLTYYRYLARNRAADIMEFEQLSTRLHLARSNLMVERRELKSLEKDQLSQRKELSDARGERSTLVAALKSEIGSQERQLTVMKQDARRLERLLDGIGEVALPAPADNGGNTGFRQMRGRLSLPLTGRISGLYGQARPGADIPWQGIFMDAAEGTEVRAIYAGRVAFADWLRGFGLLLILDHGDGFMSLYSHNQSLFRQVGEWVETGGTVALVGSSGGRANPGLYFEVRENGEPLNPLIWCKVQ